MNGGLTKEAYAMWLNPKKRGSIEWYIGYSLAMHWVNKQMLWARRYRVDAEAEQTKGVDMDKAIAESLELEGSEVIDTRKVFHVQIDRDDGKGWVNTNWGNNRFDETFSWRGTWDQACLGLKEAEELYTGYKFRIHADDNA